jgi:hypothetical protein
VTSGSPTSWGALVSSVGSTRAAATAPSNSSPLAARLKKTLNLSPRLADKYFKHPYRHRAADL